IMLPERGADMGAEKTKRKFREGMLYLVTEFLSSKVMVEALLPVMKKWIAGPKIKDAIEAVRKLNAEGRNRIGLINFLGEHYKKKEQVNAMLDEYLSALDKIKRSGIRTTISIKPTQAGMDISEEYCYETTRKIVARAKESGIFVWVDMEGSKYTTGTLALYSALAREFDNVGTVLQANLKRTKNDLRTLLKENPDAKIRLCKGAYKEGADIAFQTKKEVDKNFGELIEIAFYWANNVILASHDDKLIEMARELKDEYWPRRYLEVQFLKGIREKYRRELSAEGVNVAVYVPYGPESVQYCFRRFVKGKNTAAMIVRSILYS
ncbi:MAG: proline dehydrogenase family protein, partial [Candidatus Micrarchaeota archaeon]